MERRTRFPKGLFTLVRERVDEPRVGTTAETPQRYINVEGTLIFAKTGSDPLGLMGFVPLEGGAGLVIFSRTGDFKACSTTSAPLVQWAERLICNQLVASSSLAGSFTGGLA